MLSSFNSFAITSLELRSGIWEKALAASPYHHPLFLLTRTQLLLSEKPDLIGGFCGN